MMGGRGTSAATRSSQLAGPVAAPGATPDAPGSFSAGDVRAAYDRLADGPGDWVNLADIRAAFPGVSRDRMDTMLRSLEQRDDVNIVPQANEKSISQRTRDAAVRIGRQEKHFIAMGI